MHEDIVRFETSGTTDNNATTRELWIAEAERQMREAGYVPSIDLAPQYTVEYVADEENFHFVLSIYGVKVGIENSWDVSGVTNGKRISKHSAPAKLSQS